MGSDRKPLGTLAALALTGILLSAAVLAVSADAAKGCKGGPKRGCGDITPTVTLTVSPDPVPAGTYATVTGTGFTPGATINFVVDGGWVVGTGADANGVARISFMVHSPGTVGVAANQFNGSSWDMVGTLTFQVV